MIATQLIFSATTHGPLRTTPDRIPTRLALGEPPPVRTTGYELDAAVTGVGGTGRFDNDRVWPGRSLVSGSSSSRVFAA